MISVSSLSRLSIGQGQPQPVELQVGTIFKFLTLPCPVYVVQSRQCIARLGSLRLACIDSRLTSYGKCSSGSKLRVWMGVLEILCRVLVSSDDCEPRLATFLKRPQGCGLLQIGGCLLLLPSKAASRALRPSSCPPSDSLPTTPPQ